MPALHAIDPDTVTGKTRELIDFVRQSRGRVPNLVRHMANSPAVLGAYLGFARTMAEAALPPVLQGLVAVAAAEASGSDYTSGIVQVLAERNGATPEAIAAARLGAAPDAKTDSALKFARDLVASRGRLPEARVQALKRAGLTDSDIVEIVGIVCLNLFRAYVSLVARPDLDFAPAPALPDVR